MALTRPRAYQIYDIDYKQATRVITVSNITLSGGAPSQVDGVNLSLNDRVLVTGQSNAAQNGIYYVTTVGTGSNGTWARSTDTNSTGELLAGTIVMVTEGLIYHDTQWKLTTDDPIVIGTSELIFEQNSAFAFGNVYANGTAVLATSVGDVLTLTAGNNITIGGNNTSKTVTIGVTGISLNSISNGTSNVNVVSSGGNVTVGVNGTGNVAVFSSNGLTVAGNITGGNITTDGIVSATGNINTAGAVNITGTDGMYNVLNITGTALGPYGGSQTWQFFTQNAVPGGPGSWILFPDSSTQTTAYPGSSSALSLSGNITGGNLIANSAVVATGNITGGNLITNGLTSVTGNITGGNLVTAGQVVATDNVTGGNLITAGRVITGTPGNANSWALLPGTERAFLGSNIFSPSTTNFSLSTNGIDTRVNAGTGPLVLAIANTAVATIANSTSGMAVTGTLSSTGNITGENILGNGAALTGINSFSTITVTGGNSAVADSISDTLTITAGSGISLIMDSSTDTLTIAAGASGESIFSTGGQMETVTDTVTASEDLGLVTEAPPAQQYDLAGLYIDGFVGNPNFLPNSIYGNILVADAVITTTGNITGGNLITSGLASVGTTLSVTGNANVGNLGTSGLVIATGNVTGGNLITSGAVYSNYNTNTANTASFNATGGNTKGGTGYLDFLVAQNTSGGATNPYKWIRVNSTGGLEIVNSAYSATIFSVSDGGNVNANQYQIAGKKAVNGPAFSAYAAAILQTITSGSQQKVLFQTEEFDTDNCYTNSRFTPNVEGYYQLNAEVRLDGTSGTGEMMIILYKNGSEYKRGTNQSGTQIAANFWAMQVSSLAYANGTTDYFEIYVQQGSGADRTVTAVNNTAITWFNGCMVRGA